MKMTLIIFLTIFLHIECFAKQDDTITFAAFYNFSGPQSSLDIFSANGAKLAVDSINKSGGLLGKKIQLLFLDGKSNPEVLAKLAKDVSKRKELLLTFGLNDTDMAQAVIPPLAKVGKLFITSGATSPNLPLMFPKNVFMACFTDDKQAQAAAKFSFYDLHARKTLIIAEKNYEYAKVLTKFYNEAWDKLSADKNSFSNLLIGKKLTEKNFIIKAIKTMEPDDIFVAGDPIFVINISKFIRSNNYKKPILGGDSFDSEEVKNVQEGNIYYTTHSFVAKENPDPIVQIFIKHYEEKFKQEPDSSFAALGFDTVYLLAHAVTLAQSTDSEKVANAIHKIKNHHLITGNITFFPETNVPEKSLTIIHVQDGKKSVAGTIE